MCPHIVFKFRDYSLQIRDLLSMPANQPERGLLIDRSAIFGSPSERGLKYSCTNLRSRICKFKQALGRALGTASIESFNFKLLQYSIGNQQ